MDGAEEIENILIAKEISVEDVENISKEDYEACVIISERNIRSKKPFVWLRPKNVYVGIGCKRGTAEELIKDAFYRALETAVFIFIRWHHWQVWILKPMKKVCLILHSI